MPDISILIPTLRPEAIARTITEFYATNADVEYELVVVGPFKVSGVRTKWVEEKVARGSVYATNIALNNASGNYVVYFADDASPTENCLKHMLNLMETRAAHPFLGAFKMTTLCGHEIGPFGAYNRLYACYGCINKSVATKMVLFDSNFLYSWCDIDLSLRVWEAGGKVVKSDRATVIPKQIEDEVYSSHRQTFQRDFDTFVGKWHSKMGDGLPKEASAINHKL